MAFATWKRDERKKQVPTKMNPQKMWQTWSLSDLAGEPNSNGGRPPFKFKVVSEQRKCLCLGERANYRIGVWGDEEAVTDDVGGRNKEN